MPRILLSIDIFQDSHIRRIAEAVEGWGSWERVPEHLPSSGMQKKLCGSEIMVGWAPAPLLASSGVSLYLCGSAGLDAYRGHGLDKKNGFIHCNAAGVMSVPIADHAIAMMFALTRQLPQHGENWRGRRFVRIRDAREITGSSACIVGVGGSGTEIARRCLALGMQVSGVRLHADRPHKLISSIYPLSRLAEAVAPVDHVFCTLPASPESRQIFDASIFSAMKLGARFYNVSRGSVVNEPSLISALWSGPLAGAGIDVLEHEPPPPGSLLWECPNLLVTGHSAGWSDKLPDRLCDLFVTNLLNRREGRPLINVVPPSSLS